MVKPYHLQNILKKFSIRKYFYKKFIFIRNIYCENKHICCQNKQFIIEKIVLNGIIIYIVSFIEIGIIIIKFSQKGG